MTSYFSILVGTMMGAQWLFFLATGSVPELVSAPLAIAFHLAAEGTTAVLLIVTGVGLLRGWRWATPVNLLAIGMLIYAMINSAGYFAEQAEWGMVALLLLLALFFPFAEVVSYFWPMIIATRLPMI